MKKVEETMKEFKCCSTREYFTRDVQTTKPKIVLRFLERSRQTFTEHFPTAHCLEKI